jgi:hypothetical protein
MFTTWFLFCFVIKENASQDSYLKLDKPIPLWVQYAYTPMGMGGSGYFEKINGTFRRISGSGRNQKGHYLFNTICNCVNMQYPSSDSIAF